MYIILFINIIIIKKRMTSEESTDNEINLDKTIEDAKGMLSILQNLKLKEESNLTSKFFQYLDKSSISQLIIPFLDIQDMINLRSTCRDLNNTVTSMKAFVIFKNQILLKIKKEKKVPQIDMNILKQDISADSKEDVQLQIRTLNEVKTFLTEKLFQSEKIIKAYRSDIEYLKGEMKSNEDITKRLNEIVEHSNEEKEELKKENIILKQKLDNITMKYEENTKQSEKTIDDLKKDIDGLKTDKMKLTAALVQLKKKTDELKKKNVSKAEALKAIKNFFINSSLSNLKNIPEFNNNTTTTPAK